MKKAEVKRAYVREEVDSTLNNPFGEAGFTRNLEQLRQVVRFRFRFGSVFLIWTARPNHDQSYHQTDPMGQQLMMTGQ